MSPADHTGRRLHAAPPGAARVSMPGNTPPPERPVNPAAATKGDGAKLAHELASLLDGCLRNVNMVVSSLRGPARRTPAAAQDEANLIRRLETANQAMEQMARLIHHWMAQSYHPQALSPAGWTLGQVVGQAVSLIEPTAAAYHVELRVDLDAAIAALPAGPIYPAIANALRNSVEACRQFAAAAEPERQARPGQVDLSARHDGGWVEVIISDDGPGLDPASLDERGRLRLGVTTKTTGHGLGLPLAHEIIQSLGGTLELANRQPHGAVLVLRYPVPEPGPAGNPGPPGIPGPPGPPGSPAGPDGPAMH